MSEDTSRKQLPMELQEAIDRVTDRFEAELRAGNRPPIEEFLRQAPLEAHTPALWELLSVEVEHLRASGESIDVANYRRRFGQHQALINEIAAALETSRQEPSLDPTVDVRPDGSVKDSDFSHQPAASHGSSAPTQQQPPQLPRRYRIIRELGSGGFGQVFLAHDEELDRNVAIKMLRASPRSTGWADQLRSEARRAAALDHPNIVPVYDVGTTDKGHRFVVSKFVQGGNLTQLIKAGSITHDESARVIAALADGLQHAHAEGLVHRDVKPDNVLIDSKGCPMLADFGLALHEDEQHDRQGEVSGSPPYMAPEQTAGRSQHLDGRTDIWALGVLLYEMLTGRRPFTGKTLSFLLAEINERDPKPPRQIDYSIPEALQAICLKCLEKPVRNRYATAGDVAKECRSFLDQFSGETDPRIGIQPNVESAGGSIKRQRVVGVASAVIASVLILGALSLWPESAVVDVDRLAVPSLETKASNFINPQLDVLVWNERGQGLSLRDDYDALPLHSGDEIRIEAKTDAPAYLYLFWIDGGGEIQTLYPWQEYDWSLRPAEEPKVTQVSFPQDPGASVTLTGGTATSTVLLVARSMPLPDEHKLQSALKRFPRIREPNGPLLAQLDRAATDADRAGLSQPKASDDSILRARQFLAETFGEGSGYRAFTFRTILSAEDVGDGI